MPDDPIPNNQNSADLPSYVPLPPDEAADDRQQTDVPGAVAPGDTHPVFGSDVQPQQIVDEKSAGLLAPDAVHASESPSGNFDPENDPRTRQDVSENNE